jgi:hypothetical protein
MIERILDTALPALEGGAVAFTVMTSEDDGCTNLFE